MFPVQTGTEQRETEGGLPYELVSLSIGGDRAVVVIPAQTKPRTGVTFVSYNHGYTANELDVIAPTFAGPLHDMVERGWIVTSGNNGGFTWGNETSMRSIRSLHAWAADQYTIDQSVLIGGSMGGLTALVAAGRNEIPHLAATIAYISVVDVQAMGTGYHDSIKSAWSVDSLDELTTVQAGYDPARDDPAAWAGKAIWLNANTNDTLVPKALHGDVFMARAARPETITYHVGDTAHTLPLGYGVDVPWRAWLDALAPWYDESQEPEPVDPVDPPPTPAPSSELYRTDGTPVTLYTSAGSPVRVSRAG